MDYHSTLDQINEIIQTIEGKVGIAARLLDGKGEILINATDIFPTASTMKVPVLYELYRQVEQEKINFQQRVEYRDTHPVCGSGILQDLDFGLSLTIRDLAVLMTVLSDNTATDLLLDMVDIKQVQATMRNLGLEQTMIAISLREMMYSLAGYDINDPLNTFEKVRDRLMKARSEDKCRATAEEDNDLSSPLDMLRLLTDIAQAQTLRRESCDDMIEIMSRQKFNEIIPLYLPYGTRVAHKTGSIVTVRNDVGIVYAPERPYTIALMSKELLDETDTTRKLARVSELIYNYFVELS